VVCLSVGRSVTILIPAKTAELIQMPFGVWTPVGPMSHVLDPPYKGTISKGGRYLPGKQLAEKARSTILLQWNSSFE